MQQPEEVGQQNVIQHVGTVFTEYEAFVKGLFKTREDFTWNLTHAALGIGGEAGEVVDLIKKTYANGKTLDGDKLVKELGDLMFYIQACCNVINIPLQVVIQQNVHKLSARYPDGYSDAAASARADENPNIAPVKPVEPVKPPSQNPYELPHGYKMGEKSFGNEYRVFIQQGWTKQQMIEHEYIVPIDYAAGATLEKVDSAPKEASTHPPIIQNENGVEVIDFDSFVAYGREHGNNQREFDMPWSFDYKGCPVTHGNDELYLLPQLNGQTLRFGKEDVLITMGKHWLVMNKDVFLQTSMYKPEAGL